MLSNGVWNTWIWLGGLFEADVPLDGHATRLGRRTHLSARFIEHGRIVLPRLTESNYEQSASCMGDNWYSSLPSPV